ncbi:hypothetical protein [Microterricola viridarii]|uniref:Uncharacterized protein n=1 Tax=Microterricola viridarii TaxID=412690 RepID=A0A109QWI5_9MICO|nr:hypothetical protein [Microterricola viridarii]AMB58099.1 hypothetical protein AWU67_03605 [Microterricola viridarii]
MILAAAVAVSGCSSVAGSGTAAPGAGSGTGAPADTAASGDVLLSQEDSPLAAFAPLIWGGPGAFAFSGDAAIEALLAPCMRDAGFEYTLPAGDGVSPMLGPVGAAERATEEWVERNGYGLAHSLSAMEALMEAAIEYVDPNEEYLSSLSESEASAYFEALYGPGATDEDWEAMREAGPDDYDWESAGCYGSATLQTQNAGTDAYSDPKYQNLLASMGSVYVGLYSDPSLQALERSWASCMADAGYSGFTAKQDAFNFVAEAQGGISDTLEYDSEGGVSFGAGQEAVAAATQLEIDVALADFHCAEALDYAQKTLKVQFALEARFVDDNRAELDALRAEYPAMQ